jgi:hypothetical protein
LRTIAIPIAVTGGPFINGRGIAMVLLPRFYATDN